jgi:hypothetical protein
LNEILRFVDRVSLYNLVNKANLVHNLFLIAQDDGTDIEFRNVGFYTSDAGEIPKRTQTTFLIAQDDGTDIEFRNVGFYTSDAGEIPKRTQTTF